MSLVLFVLLSSFFAFSQDENCHLNQNPKIEELSGEVCMASDRLLNNEPVEVVSEEEKKEFSKKIQSSFDELKADNIENVNKYKASIIKLEEQIKNKKDLLTQAKTASEKQNLQYQLEQLETRLASKKKNLEKSEHILNNLNNRFDQVTDLVVKKGCKGLLKNVSITTGNKVIKKAAPGQGLGSAVLADFGTEDEADAYKIQLLEENAHYTSCAVKEVNSKTQGSFPKSVVASRSLPKIAGAGNSFIDNGKGLGATSVEFLNNQMNGASGWKESLRPTTDALGRKVERKLTKIKIYTCASTYRNCSPNTVDKRTPDQDGCGNLDLLRAFSDTDILNALNGRPSPASGSGLLSKADAESLKTVLNSPYYKEAVKNLGPDQSTQEAREKRLWIALSSMRAESMASKIKADMGPDASEAKFEIIPTGHPNDPFNNSKIDPALTGTCGPLPETADSFYGQCLKATCSVEKPVCTKLKKYYDQPEIKLAREQMLKERGIDPSKASAQEKFAAHRYYQIEPEMVETTTETKESTLSSVRYQVSCTQLKLMCKKTDITPDFNIPSFGVSSKQGGIIQGGGGTSCPAW